MKKKIIIAVWWVLVAVCLGVFFYLSAQDGGTSEALSDEVKTVFGIPVAINIIRKGAHFLEFAGLAFLVFNALRATCGRNRPALSFFITAAYAVSDEIHQLFVEGRACRIFDVFVDSCGAAAAILFMMFIFSVWEKRRLYDRK